jgi:carbamoyl-phosphate synthase large subunit
MPRRNDLHRILIVGSGPIIIGQACEFDYSGAQACKALKADGYEVVLINSNPATIMTDPDLADRTYVEPLSVAYAEEVIRRERPDALLSTVGGQTGLNLSVELAEAGVLDKYGVELIGAKIESIKKAEDRLLFKDAMRKIGLETPQSQLVNNVDDGLAFAARVPGGYPVILRPSFTMGGSGGGIAYNREELAEILERGLDLSPVHEVLIEESVLGWKEFELEVMRDVADNAIIVCSIENFDPMGVHTGDSITVAPAQTLTDREYQMMRDASLRCLREIGVDTGGSNVQFAINPENGRMVIVEMNPRVSRSSALASKATGFPIAKIAAKLAVGYRLDEIKNDITKVTPACFEPTLDYVVVKIPRWQFEKFPGAEPVLGTQMKSVGEVMAIGRTFKQALGKGLRSLETGKAASESYDPALIRQRLITPNPERLGYIRFALEQGWTVEQIHEITSIDPWFLKQLRELADLEHALSGQNLGSLARDRILEAKRDGVSDVRLGQLFGADANAVRVRRKQLGITAVFNRVDTCAAEFESFTPYLYSSYESENESDPGDRKKVMILGSGPNRIGQGIEFDYCCCHAAYALADFDHESIMVNCNPETVSTDYDTSDRLYFEPLTLEEVLNIHDVEQPDGVIVQFGGQTPLNLALPLKAAGVKIIGTDPANIDLAEDRKLFGRLLDDLGIPSPENGTATSAEEACAVARRLGYPVLVRPSYVLGGRAMVIAYDEEMVRRYMHEAVVFSQERPVLIDRFLEDATEVDVDALADQDGGVLIAGIMEHIEEAGVHSGDSSCVLPPQGLSAAVLQTIQEYTERLARALHVIGLMNVQYAIKDGMVYVLEVNPRASRTVPYVSKATGVPLAKLAVGLMLGKKLRDFEHLTGGRTSGVLPVPQCFVKSPVFPFGKFPGVDPALGPEMRSTGEVMGVGENFGEAFGKAQLSAGTPLPESGTVFISVNDRDKAAAVEVAAKFAEHGFQLAATRGTAAVLKAAGLQVKTVFKVNEGRPNAVDIMKAGSLKLVIYTTTGGHTFKDERDIRRTAVAYRIPCITTLSGAKAAAQAIVSRKRDPIRVWNLQEIHKPAGVATTP